jgi:hypothetical protein
LKIASPISRRATNSAKRIATGRRWCSGATARKPSPTSRLSKTDAEIFRDWNRRAEEIIARILMPEPYAEPLPRAERAALLAQTAHGRDFLAISRRQPLDVVQELFENDHVKLLFLFKVSLFGTWLTDMLSKTSPTGSVIRAFDLATSPVRAAHSIWCAA